MFLCWLCRLYALLRKNRPPKTHAIAWNLHSRNGTRYGLLDDGWIQELDGEAFSESEVEPRRRVYGITERGKEAVAMEMKRMSHAVLTAESAGLGGGR